MVRVIYTPAPSKLPLQTPWLQWSGARPLPMTVRTGWVCVGSRNEGQKIMLKEFISVTSLEF